MTMNGLLCLSLTLLSIAQTPVKGVDIVPEKSDQDPPPTPGLPKTDPVVDIGLACNMTKDKAFCVNALSSNPQSKGVDIIRLALLSLQMAQAKGLEVSGSIQKKQLAKPPPAAAKALQDCSDEYKKALAHISDCVSGLNKDEIPFNDVRTWLSGMVTGTEVCNHGLVEAKLPADQLATIANRDFTKLCENTISVVTTMQSDALAQGTTETLS